MVVYYFHRFGFFPGIKDAKTSSNDSADLFFGFDFAASFSFVGSGPLWTVAKMAGIGLAAGLPIECEKPNLGLAATLALVALEATFGFWGLGVGCDVGELEGLGWVGVLAGWGLGKFAAAELAGLLGATTAAVALGCSTLLGKGDLF